jgi:hypothetical protein
MLAGHVGTWTPSGIREDQDQGCDPAVALDVACPGAGWFGHSDARHSGIDAREQRVD